MGKYSVEIKESAKKDLLKIYKSGDKATIKKIEAIVLELEKHPETGIGNPEALKHSLTGYWSRRINKKDRLIYEIIEAKVLVSIVKLSGHYNDK
jgi:toxin YoeB